MRTKVFLRLIVLFCLYLVGASSALADENKDMKMEESSQILSEINWYKNDFPPYFILKGPYKGLGILDRLYPHIISALPSYKHNFFVTNNPGFFKRVALGHNVCSLSLMKTEERAKHVYFSKPYLFLLQNGLFIRNSDIEKFVEYFTSDGKVVLSRLIKDKDLVLGVKRGVSYGGGLDEIISANIDNKNIVSRKGKDLNEGLFKMLRLGRIDYLIAYDESMNFMITKLDVPSNFLFIPIDELPKQHLNQAGVSCSKNEFGKKVINEINKILEDEKIIEQTKKYYMNWLSNDAILEYKKILKEKNETMNEKAERRNEQAEK